MSTDAELLDLANRVAGALLTRQCSLVTAESCTGGWMGKVLTDLPGSSAWYRGGVVAYSNVLKQALLGVATPTLAVHGAVSAACAAEMAGGALTRLGGEFALAVTGIAGPDGGQPDKPVGTVWFAWAWQQAQGVQIGTAMQRFEGDREAVRRATVAHSLEQAARIIRGAWR